MVRFAFDQDLSPHFIHQGFNQGQAQAGSGNVTGFVCLNPEKLVKNLVQLTGFYPIAVVFHVHPYLVVVNQLGFYQNFAAFLGVFNGIGDEIAENGFQSHVISRDLWQWLVRQFKGQGLISAFRLGPDEIHNIFQ